MPIPVAMVLPGENSVAAKKLPSVMLRAGEDRRIDHLVPLDLSEQDEGALELPGVPAERGEERMVHQPEQLD